MKTTFKLRVFLVLISILFLLPTLAACGDNDVPPSPQVTDGVTTEAPEKETTPPPLSNKLTLSQADAKSYSVIMPKSCPSEIREAALDLFDDMRDSGFVLQTCTFDGGADETNIPENACEILIGQTNRSQSAAFSVGLRMDDFTIAAEGNTIIIAGGSTDAIISAITYFFENYVKDATEIRILDVHTVTGEYDVANLVDMSVNCTPISEYSISLPLQSSAAFDYAVSLLTDVITEKTAYQLPVKREAEAQGKSIRIELSDTLDECEFSYSLQNDVWTIQATDRTIFYAIRNVVAQISGLTVSMYDFAEGESGTFLMSTEIAPTHSTLEGKLPVALCDQQNGAAVIIDLAAADPTASSAVLWEWKPTSALGFNEVSRFGNRIDEFKLRYSTVLNKYVVCTTSSAGFIGLAEYPSGKKIWEDNAYGYGPHSIDYLPTGNIAVALSGNGNEGKQEIRLYACDKNGIPTNKYVRDELISAHGILWDNDWGILWALGDTELIAYEVGGTPQEPTLTRISGLGCTIKSCGHDFSLSPNDAGKFYFSSNSVYVFNKYTNTLDANFDGSALIKAGAVKSIAEHTDGSILRAVAANVYASHDTNILDVFRKNSAGEWVKTSYTFTGRAFYKARPFILC